MTAATHGKIDAYNTHQRKNETDREVEARFLQVRHGNGTGGGFPITADPALHQPIGRIESGGVERGECGLAVAGKCAQQSIQQPPQVVEDQLRLYPAPHSRA